MFLKAQCPLNHKAHSSKFKIEIYTKPNKKNMITSFIQGSKDILVILLKKNGEIIAKSNASEIYIQS